MTGHTTSPPAFTEPTSALQTRLKSVVIAGPHELRTEKAAGRKVAPVASTAGVCFLVFAAHGSSTVKYITYRPIAGVALREIFNEYASSSVPARECKQF